MEFKRRSIVALIVICLLTTAIPTGYAVAEDTSSSTKQEIYRYLSEDMGFPTAAVCGIMANMEHESGFRPNAVGDNGTSFGLCQWHNGRFDDLKSFCLITDMDYASVEGQLLFLRYDLGQKYSKLFSSLRNIENSPEGAYQSAYLWCIEYERPANMYEQANNRGNTAKNKYWYRYEKLGAIKDRTEITEFTFPTFQREPISSDIGLPLETPEIEFYLPDEHSYKSSTSESYGGRKSESQSIPPQVDTEKELSTYDPQQTQIATATPSQVHHSNSQRSMNTKYAYMPSDLLDTKYERIENALSIAQKIAVIFILSLMVFQLLQRYCTHWSVAEKSNHMT